MSIIISSYIDRISVQILYIILYRVETSDLHPYHKCDESIEVLKKY